MKCVKEVENGVIIIFHVIPGAKKREIEYNSWKDMFILKLTSPPTKGKANRELIKFIEKEFGGKVKIIKGEKATIKTILIEKINKEKVLEKLRGII